MNNSRNFVFFVLFVLSNFYSVSLSLSLAWFMSFWIGRLVYPNSPSKTSGWFEKMIRASVWRRRKPFSLPARQMDTHSSFFLWNFVPARASSLLFPIRIASPSAPNLGLIVYWPTRKIHEKIPKKKKSIRSIEKIREKRRRVCSTCSNVCFPSMPALP